jgi:hypothetical protein
MLTRRTLQVAAGPSAVEADRNDGVAQFGATRSAADEGTIAGAPLLGSCEAVLFRTDFPLHTAPVSLLPFFWK